ncbi:hypothetical protein RYX36_025897 [Vicia faba]
MEPILRNEKIFQKFLYAYLIEKGYENTAELFRNDIQLTEPLLDPDEPPGILLNFWNAIYEDYNSRRNQVIMQQPSNSSTRNQVIVQQPGNTSMQSQVVVQPLNIGPIINTATAQRIPIQLHSSFESVAAKLLSCDISSDGKIVASGGHGAYGKKPFICYTETGISVTTQDTHKKSITEVRFQPNFNLLATASVDASIKLWDATTRETVLRYMEHKALRHRGTVRSLDFHPLDNKTLCSSDNIAIKVWDLNKYTNANGFKEGGSVVRVQPVYGSLLAVANGNGITILDYHNLLVAKKLEGHVKAITSMCWDDTGKMIASVSEDEARVWSVNEGQCIHNCAFNGKKFQSVIFHPRYHMTLVVGGHQCLLLLNFEDMMQYSTSAATKLSITGLAATKAQSQFIVSASDDSLVKIWK